MSIQRAKRGLGMRLLLSGFGIAISLLCSLSYAHGQKATERYIPIGQSPGVSRKYTSIGLIASVNPGTQTITIADSAGPRTVKISEKTRIWIDRNKLKLPNLTGRFADLQKGRRVEVKYEDPGSRRAAEWVKVEITRP